MSKFVETVTMEKSTYDAMVERERELSEDLLNFRMLITTREIEDVKIALLNKEMLVDWINYNYTQVFLGKYADVRLQEEAE